MKHGLKRLLSLALALCMILSVVPVSPVSAADYATTIGGSGSTVKDLGVSVATTYSKAEPTVTWDFNGDILEGSLVGGQGIVNNKFYYYYTATSTITLTNNKEMDAELTFTYDATIASTGDYVTVNGVKQTASITEQSVSVTLGAGESIDIVLYAKQKNQSGSYPTPNGASISVYNLKLTGQGNVQVSFGEATNGTYSVTELDTSGAATDTVVTIPSTLNTVTTTRYTLSATPAEDYAFGGWLYTYADGTSTYLSADPTFTTLFPDNGTIKPVFIPKTDGVYAVGSALFTNLADAAAAALGSTNKVAILLKNDTLTSDCTIPYGVTVVIPYSADLAVNTSDPDTIVSSDWVTPTAYCTLTLDDNVTLTVNGNLTANAQHYACQGSGNRIYGGAVYKTYGAVYMESGSQIVLNSGANLYAWGYVWGEGKVTANAGASVYEKMQITDYRGGGNTSTIALRNTENGKTDGAFPFNQYYIQNVEVEEVLMPGASLWAHAGVYLSGEDPAEASVCFVGEGSAMFSSTGATVTKKYDASTDRLIIDVDGDEDSEVYLKGICLSVGGMDVDSQNFTLPINGNITININGGTAVVDQELVLQPGTRVNIGEDAMLTNNANIFLMDIDQWGNYVFSDVTCSPIQYSPSFTGPSNRTISSDAVIDVNGDLYPLSGIYTTEGGASIISSQMCGSITYMNDADADGASVYQIVGGSDLQEIPVTAMLLSNGVDDPKFVPTADALAEEYYTYDADFDMWVKNDTFEYLVTWMNGEEELGSRDVEIGQTPVYPGETAPTKDGCTFLGWNTDPDATEALETLPKIVSSDVTLYAIFSEPVAVEYLVTWKNIDGTTVYYEDVSYGDTPAFNNYQTPVYPDSMAEEGYDYTWCGWSEEKGGEKLDQIPVCTGEATYYAVYDKTAKSYLVTWTVNDEWYAEDYIAYGDTITAPEYTVPEGYTFSGWDVPETMPAQNITLDATLTVNTYTVTWTVDGEAYAATDVDYGDAITEPETDPEKEGYTFVGWVDVPKTMPAEDITIASDWEVNTYTVTWIVDDEVYTTTQATYGQAIALPETDPSKTGYTFNGWKDVPETMPANESLTIEADFTANEYQVSWYANGGVFKLGGITLENVGTNVAYDSVIAFTGYNLPTREGYTFTGWADAAGNALTADTVMNTTDNLTAYYAQWQINTYTITYTINGEAYGEPVSYTYGEAITAPDYTCPVGHTFSGWDVPATMPAQNLTLDATLTVNKYTLAIYANKFSGDEDAWSTFVKIQVPYGALIADYIPEAYGDIRIYQVGDTVEVSGSRYEGTFTITSWVNYMTGSELDLATATMPAEELGITNSFSFTGWVHQYYDYVEKEWSDTRLGTEYWIDSVVVQGWQEIDGAWYYFAPANVHRYFRAEGLSRAPYPVDEDGEPLVIEGNTYVPDQETIDYCAKKGIEFIDAEEAWFVFAEDGKFQSSSNGIVTFQNAKRWAVNGMLPWHPGLVEVDDVYYYFLGDESIGGNILATGDIYVQRNNTERNFVIGGVYTFDDEGILCEYNGITEMADGTLRYYEDAQLMLGKGLIKVEDDYYYVRSNGELVVGTSYWVENTNGYDIVPGTYEFDEDGKMINPAEASKNGVYAEDNGLFYYEDGKRVYKGLMTYSDGENYNGEYIYVRSNGQLATGRYWITETNGLLDAGYYDFDELGRMQKVKNGIVAENDSLYYYENGSIVYGAGLIELGGNYYYVRSNGEVVHGQKYWITTTNDTGVVAKQYTFDDNGVLQNPEFEADQKNGIVEEDGVLYYYENGTRAYGKGLVKLEGGYIYVRSNGQLAIGNYWITTTNGLMDQGLYTFGDDGFMVE